MGYQEIKMPWADWEIVKPIGEGGYGAVYEIERSRFGIKERAAMKVITIPQSAAEIDNLKIEGYDNQSITQRFTTFAEDIVQEYGTMAQMKGNANIVYCDDYTIIQQDNGFGWDIYIKMELLTPLLKAMDLVASETQIIRFATEMCNALEVCQRRQVIHRDIKPQNIFVSDDGVFKLGDFGIARKAEKTTRATVGRGTYQFMAPEVKNGLPYGPTVDIYSLGLVMYWLLNNRRSPFLPLPPVVPKYSDEENAQKRRFSGEKIPAPKNGSEELKRIVLKACAFDPKDRYQSAREMREAMAPLTSENTYESTLNNETIRGSASTLDFDGDDQTAGPNFESKTGSETGDPEVTVGPVFSVDLADEGKTVGPDFSPKHKPEPPERKNRWIGIAIAVCAVICIFVLLLDRIDGDGVSGKVVENVSANAPGNTSENTTDSSSRNSDIQGSSSEMLQFVENKLKVGIISTGGPNVVLLKHDGTAVATGRNDSGQCNVGNWTDVVAISSSCFHTVGLKSDGTVVAAGLDGNQQCEVATWTDIVQVAAGMCHTVGLKSDGTVIAAGNNDGSQWDMGQCDVSDWTDIVYVAASDYYTIGVKSDGTIVETGDSTLCGGKDNWKDIISVACDGYRIVGLKSDGTVVAFVRGLYSDCDYSDWTDIVAIAAGYYHTIGLRADGTVVSAGITSENAADFNCTYYGQCDVSNWTDVVSIAAGVNTTVGVKKDGTVLIIGEYASEMTDANDWKR